MRLCLLFLGLCTLWGAEGARILGVFHPAAPSHYFIGKRMMTELAKKGHDVTMISSFGLKDNEKMPNYRDIVLTGFLDQIEEVKKMMFKITEQTVLQSISHIFKMMPEWAENTLNHTNVQKLLNDKSEKFDLIIMEAFLNEVHLGLAHHYNCPIVILSTIGANPWVNQYTGNPSPSAYIGELLLSFGGKMTFWQRLTNVLVGTGMDFYSNFVHLPKQDVIMHKYFPDAPYIKEIFPKVAMVLLNSHVSVSPPKPHVPSMVEIGGFHMEDPKELPKDLKEYLDNCKKGFILFSMGSNFQSKNMPQTTLDTLMNVFKKLAPIQVLWKFEADLPNKPSNVRIEKWIPQNDVLAHKNLKLFITHGGLLSTTEAVYHGVPIVGIPVFGDQKMNMARAEGIGLGKALPLKELDEEKLFNIVKEVVDNPEFRINIRRRSNLMRDQPLKPIDNGVFWVEHVLRHKGADHLKTGALNLNWYELYQLDVIAFILLVVLIALYVPYKMVKCCLCRKKTSTQYKGEKKKKTN